MSENAFRKWMLIVTMALGWAMFTVAVVFTWGALLIGSRIANNGRYVQYDQQKDALVIQGSAKQAPPKVIDTRSGTVQQLKQAEL